MRAPWLLALATLFMLPATHAAAQAYQYVARTSAPAARTGAVTAGTLTWQCAGSQCTIGGPWPAPGVPACASLAGQVGRIASYGRTGAMLTTEQLAQCNANLPAVTLQIDPSLARQAIQRQQQLPTGPLITTAPSMSAAPATPPPPTQVAVEPGSRPEDLRVFALSGSTIRFSGRTPVLPPPALPVAIPLVGNRLTAPALVLQASSPGATPTPRSTTIRAPFFRYGDRGDVYLRVPISMRDMPSDALGLILSCDLSRIRFIPPPADTSPYRDLGVNGRGADESYVATGEADLQMTNINRWETTVDIPMQLRPFHRLEDARSYVCGVRMSVDRVSPPGRQQLDIVGLVDPSRSTSRAPFHPAPGTTPQLYIQGNIQ